MKIKIEHLKRIMHTFPKLIKLTGSTRAGHSVKQAPSKPPNQLIWNTFCVGDVNLTTPEYVSTTLHLVITNHLSILINKHKLYQ